MKKLLLKSFLAFALVGIASISNGQTVLLGPEGFSSGMPAGWSQDSAGLTPYYLWDFTNPGVRVITGAGFDANFVILDSDHNGTGESQDVYLNLPSVNASGYSYLHLEMDEQYRDYTNGFHQIEVSTDAGATWNHILSDSDITSVGYPNPAVHSIYDITSIGAGQSDVRIRFHYAGTYAWWWAIDNVSVIAPLAPPPPPANDDCANAVSLTVGSTCAPTTGTVLSATNSGTVGCAGNADDDVWYSFVANDTVVAIQVSGHGSNNPVIEVFDNCGGTSVACINANFGNFERGLARTLTNGNTYYVRVYSFGTALLDSSDFDICVTNVVFPANDNCANAILITPVAGEDDCNTNTLAVTDLSTPSAEPITCSTSNYFDDIWYYFVATQTDMTVQAFNLSPDVVPFGGVGYALYDGSCAGTELFCENNGTGTIMTSFTGLTIGNTYYLRTFTASGLTEGSWNLCVFGGLFTGVHEASNSKGLQLFPDPTTGLLNISFADRSAKTTVRVFDMIGNLMKEETIQNMNKTTLDLSSFNNGIYFVKVENEKGLFTQKVVLSK